MKTVYVDIDGHKLTLKNWRGLTEIQVTDEEYEIVKKSEELFTKYMKKVE